MYATYSNYALSLNFLHAVARHYIAFRVETSAFKFSRALFSCILVRFLERTKQSLSNVPSRKAHSFVQLVNY